MGTCFANEFFPFGTWQEVESGVRALRVSFAGELGWELHIDADIHRVHSDQNPMRVLAHIFNVAKKNGVNLRNGGMFALLHSLRMERGFVHNGHDTHPFVTPHECGLGFTVDLKDKNIEFLGKKALLALKAQRNGSFLTQRLVSIVLPSHSGGFGELSPTGHHSEIIWRNDEVVGHFTSGGYSHVLNRPIGLGFVSLKNKPKFTKIKAYVEEPGMYQVELTNSKGKIVKVPAQIILGPLVDPRGDRLEGNYGESGTF